MATLAVSLSLVFDIRRAPFGLPRGDKSLLVFCTVRGGALADGASSESCLVCFGFTAAGLFAGVKVRDVRGEVLAFEGVTKSSSDPQWYGESVPGRSESICSELENMFE